MSFYLKTSEIIWSTTTNKKSCNGFIERMSMNSSDISDGYNYNSEYFLKYLYNECNNNLSLALAKVQSKNPEMYLYINCKIVLIKIKNIALIAEDNKVNEIIIKNGYNEELLNREESNDSDKINRVNNLMNIRRIKRKLLEGNSFDNKYFNYCNYSKL